MLEPESYVLRRRIDGKDEYVPITLFDIVKYRCGLSAGDQISVIKDIVIKDADDNPTEDVIAKGDVYTVLKGSSEDPTNLILRGPDGELHMWDDDESIWDSFSRLT